MIVYDRCVICPYWPGDFSWEIDFFNRYFTYKRNAFLTLSIQATPSNRILSSLASGMPVAFIHSCNFAWNIYGLATCMKDG